MSFCRCKYTAREEYAPALLKHRLDEKLKIYGFTRETTLLLSILLGVVTSVPYGVHRKPVRRLFLSMQFPVVAPLSLLLLAMVPSLLEHRACGICCV